MMGNTRNARADLCNDLRTAGMTDTPACGREHANVIIEPLLSACAEMQQHDSLPAQMLPAMSQDVETCLEVATFYRQNPSPNVLARDPLSIMGHLRDRTCTVARVHDRSGVPLRDGQATNIAGAAMCHQYVLPVSAPGSERCLVSRHFEFGTVRVRMSGFGLLARLQSIRMLDMLLRPADRINPFACVFEENASVVRGLEQRHFARVPMPSREMLALRDDELRRTGTVPRPIVYLKPTMATFLLCADELCRLRAEPHLERNGVENDGFASVASIENAFSQRYPAEVFDAAGEMSRTRPATLADLGRVLHGDPGYFPDYFVP
jgi:hypothetical protein